MCFQKNNVYLITCQECPDKKRYIGESHRTIFSRVARGHVNGVEQSDFYEHFTEAHKRSPSVNDLDIKILGSNKDAPQRGFSFKL